MWMWSMWVWVRMGIGVVVDVVVECGVWVWPWGRAEVGAGRGEGGRGAADDGKESEVQNACSLHLVSYHAAHVLETVWVRPHWHHFNLRFEAIAAFGFNSRQIHLRGVARCRGVARRVGARGVARRGRTWCDVGCEGVTRASNVVAETMMLDRRYAAAQRRMKSAAILFSRAN